MYTSELYKTIFPEMVDRVTSFAIDAARTDDGHRLVEIVKYVQSFHVDSKPMKLIVSFLRVELDRLTDAEFETADRVQRARWVRVTAMNEVARAGWLGGAV